MKKVVKLFLGVALLVVLTACSSGKKSEADYTTKEFESALKDGENLTGKTVEVEVDKLVPDGALGYTVWSGEHLNFVSSENPNVKEGETMVVKVEEVTSALGSFIIRYEK